VPMVWLPYDDAVQRMGGLPDGFTADVWDGFGPLPGSAAEVEFFVLPYLAGVGALAPVPRMARLRVLQTLTAGYDDVLPAVPTGVTLCNAPGVHDASTAELALALMLASLRGLPDFVRAADLGRWESGPRAALADRTVLVVGYGGVGRAVERRLAGFEVDVLRVARTARVAPTGQVHPMTDLPDLLPAADVVVLCLPLTPDTRHLVDSRFLARMRDGALLVNVSRGAVVDTPALVAEIRTGRLQAALDVTDPEPLPAGHPLWSLPGVLVSPHVGGNTSAFLPRAFTFLAEQLRRYAAGQELVGVIFGPSGPARGEGH
jgi:phosphoglycerate dehydrogenase-like enzyme